jgi:molybdopterin molybdotransferase
MPSHDAALETILSAVTPLGTEPVALAEADGRILAAPLVAPHDLPAADNSAMDGFAVRTGDCIPGAVLAVSGCRAAGAPDGGGVPPGCAVRIMTGATTPPGCDAVVPFEEVDETPGDVRGNGASIRIRGPVKAAAHIRRRGEDVAAGAVAIAAGAVMRPPEIAMAAAFSVAVIEVRRRPRVAILSTGDELLPPGEAPVPGRIADANGPALAAAAREAGAIPVPLGIAADAFDALRDRMAEGLRDADCLVTTAGVSGGDRDFVKEALEALGATRHFWKIDVKPGRPTAFCTLGDKPVFSLPGNPVSAMLTFDAFVRPALRKMMGHRTPAAPCMRAILENPVTKKEGKMQFLRVVLAWRDGVPHVASAGDQNTGILGTLAAADAVALLPADRTRFESGETVLVRPLYPGCRP